MRQLDNRTTYIGMVFMVVAILISAALLAGCTGIDGTKTVYVQNKYIGKIPGAVGNWNVIVTLTATVNEYHFYGTTETVFRCMQVNHTYEIDSQGAWSPYHKGVVDWIVNFRDPQKVCGCSCGHGLGG
jgi:hypothetical protein